jgi:hypothetical protein
MICPETCGLTSELSFAVKLPVARIVTGTSLAMTGAVATLTGAEFTACDFSPLVSWLLLLVLLLAARPPHPAEITWITTTRSAQHFQKL